MDEFKFNIYVYDRLAVTPASAMQTTPKRFIGGGKTLSRYNSDGYVDTKTGDIYIVNNDSEPGLFKFPRTAEGNVEPASELMTPYGAFGMTVDEDRGEMFFTIQHDGAIQIYPKGAKGEENAIRLIQGNRTRLADPHGIAFDPKTRLLYVANYGTERDEAFGTEQQMPHPLNAITPRGRDARRPNWPAGNAVGNANRREVVFGTGKFGPPSITVHAADANGNVAPVRHIVGPKAQLNWPTGISVDSARGEVYVSNAAGDSINVYSATATGDVAPIRQIKGPKTMLRNPNGVSVDTVNGEVWVANFGNHTATAYKWDANGNAEPVRVIRSAPLNAPTTLISNPYMIAFDGRRDEVLVPNCVAQPRIAAYSTAADKNAVPSRIIEGQKTRAEPHGARDRLRRDPRRDRRAVEHRAGGGDVPRRREWRRSADPGHPGAQDAAARSAVAVHRPGAQRDLRLQHGHRRHDARVRPHGERRRRAQARAQDSRRDRRRGRRRSGEQPDLPQRAGTTASSSTIAPRQGRRRRCARSAAGRSAA